MFEVEGALILENLIVPWHLSNTRLVAIAGQILFDVLTSGASALGARSEIISKQLPAEQFMWRLAVLKLATYTSCSLARVPLCVCVCVRVCASKWGYLAL